MPRLKTITVLNSKGHVMNINEADFDAKLHRLPDEKKEAEPVKDSGDEKPSDDGPGELNARSWTELTNFVKTYELDYDVAAAKERGLKLKEASAEVEALL